jgi:hypothetical protein
MGLTFPIVIEPGGIGLSSAASSDTTFDRTKHQFDTGDYDGSPSYYFEINCINLDTDSNGKDVSLVDSGGTAKATINVPASTGTAGNWTRLRSSSFTPVSGLETYRIKLEGTNSGDDLQVLRWRWIVKPTNATKMRICYPMSLADDQACSNSEDASVWSTTHGSYLYDDRNRQNFFKFVNGQFAGDTVQYEYEVLAWKNGTNPGKTGLTCADNVDPTHVLSSSEIDVTVGSTRNILRTTIDQGDVDWISGNDYEFNVHTVDSLKTTRVFYACVYVTITNVTRARTYWALHGGWNGSTAHDAEDGRMLYEASDYQNPTAFYGQTARYITGAAGNGLELNHFSTNDGPGTTGATQVQEHSAPATKDYEEWSTSVTDTYRYGGGLWRTNNGAAIYSQFLILDIEFTPDEELEAQDDFALGEYPETPFAVTIEELEAPQDDLILTDYAEFGDAVYSYKELEAQDDFVLTDYPEIDQALSIIELEVQDDFVLTDDVEYDISEAFSGKTLVIAEMRVDQGTEYVAGKGVRHPTRYYRGLVKTWGTVVRSIPVPVGVPHIGDAVVELSDVDNRWRSIFAAIPPQNREMVLKIGAEGGSERTFYRAYTGKVKHVSFPPGHARVVLQDKTFEFLDVELEDLLTRENYDNPELGQNLIQRTSGTYEEEQVFSPIVFGDVASGDVAVLGAMNAVRLDGNTFNLAQHPIPHDEIIVYGKAPDDTDFAEVGGYSIVEEERTLNDIDYTFTHIEFSSDKVDGYEVRWDGHGMTDDETSTGTAI